MKKLIFILILIFTLPLGFVSCDDFLEKPPSVDITEDTVFSNVFNAKKMLNILYDGIPYRLATISSSQDGVFWRHFGGMLSGTTDEGHFVVTGASKFYTTLNASTVESGTRGANYSYHLGYKLIRYCWKFIERIGDVPDVTESQIKEYSAEARMIVAMQYYEFMIKLGGVPFLDHSLGTKENWNAERMPLAQLSTKIDSLIDVSMVDLPETRSPEEQGRLTKDFGYFLKARLKLAIARPLFNTDTPYLEMTNPDDNDLICMGNSDPNRYVEAAKAAKQAIDYLESEGHRLMTKDDISDFSSTAFSTVEGEAYAQACKRFGSIENNPEMIYYTLHSKNMRGIRAKWVKDIGPMGLGACRFEPSFNFMKLYEFADGTTQTAENGFDLQNPCYGKRLDPRFYASFITPIGTVLGPSSISKLIGDNVTDAKKYDLNHSMNWKVVRKTEQGTGFGMLKFLHHETFFNNKAVTLIWPYMRMAELYLIYAEALNESNASPTSECYEAVNKVRTRAGMPALTEGLNHDEMKKAIEYEWAVEFAFEGNRFYNLRQWKETQVLNEPIMQLNGRRDRSNKYHVIYEEKKLEDRSFDPRFYLYPFPLSEVNMRYGLVQNPGW